MKFVKLLSGVRRCSLRMTLKSRLATAAVAMVQSMISRSRPRVLRPVSPFRKGSMGPTADVDDMLQN